MLNILDSKNAERQRRAQVPTIKMDGVPTMKSYCWRDASLVAVVFPPVAATIFGGRIKGTILRDAQL